jgi:aldehyde dehydrogenase
MNTGSYVNGQWYRPASGAVTKNINPADVNDVIAEYPLATAADVRLALDAAVAAFPAWKKTSAAACCGAPPTSPAGAWTRSPAP